MALTTSALAVKPPPHGAQPYRTPFIFKNNIGADQLALNDVFVLSPKFQTGQFIYTPSLVVWAPTELDSNASPLLQMSFGYGGADGVQDGTFFAAGAFSGVDADRLDINDLADITPLLNVEDLYLVGKTDAAAATAASGSIWISGEIWYGFDSTVYSLS